ncbi:hypothetical protein Hanom_Chr15g01377521 [Helianthus anomalus]
MPHKDQETEIEVPGSSVDQANTCPHGFCTAAIKCFGHICMSKMPFSSIRFGQFCDFCPKVCFSASGSKRFEILTIFIRPSIFSVKSGVFLSFLLT